MLIWLLLGHIPTHGYKVNEQANAGFQGIRGQLAYMTPENFMLTLKLFLTIKNRDIQRKLDMPLLHV